MSAVLPFDIIELIIETVGGENEDTNLLKELALVSHSFHQICSKHLFATIELHDGVSCPDIASSKKGFVKLVRNRPDVVKYIRKLTYEVSHFDDDGLHSPILSNFLRTIPSLNYLIITSRVWMDWNKLNSSLTSAFLHLMHLPTVNHIDLSFIINFPLSSFTPSVNLLRLDILRVEPFDPFREDGSLLFVQSGMMPKLREFHMKMSNHMAKQMLLAKGQDGRPAFNFMDLRKLTMEFQKDDRHIRYALQNAKLLEKLHLHLDVDRSLVELHEILFPSVRTLKVLDLTVSLYNLRIPVFLGGISEELEALAGHNMLEALSFRVYLDGYETEDFIGSIIQKVEGVLVKPGWSALREISFILKVFCLGSMGSRDAANLSKWLHSLRDKYLSHLSKLDSVTLNYSVENILMT